MSKPLLKITEGEISQALNRYVFFQKSLFKLAERTETAMKNDRRWFSMAPRVAKKFWKQALSLELLFKHDWSLEENGTEKILLDISSYYSLMRAMYEAYAVFVHLFRIDRDFSENIVRFRLWEVDGLQSRLQFKRENPSEQTISQLNADEVYIGQIIQAIKDAVYFKSLPEKKQNYLLKYKAWKFSHESLQRMENNKGQHTINELIERTHIKEYLLRDIYSLYSMHVHTGYISILQNDDLSNEDKMIAKWVAIMNATFLIAYMIRELTSRFVEGKEFLESFTGKEKECIESVMSSL